jgi:hypothetical protein
MAFLEKQNPDIDAFDSALSVCRETFIQKREEHGSHFEKPQMYDRAMLYGKCIRYAAAFERGELPADEEIIDLAAYPLMVLSRKSRG